MRGGHAARMDASMHACMLARTRASAQAQAEELVVPNAYGALLQRQVRCVAADVELLRAQLRVSCPRSGAAAASLLLLLLLRWRQRRQLPPLMPPPVWLCRWPRCHCNCLLHQIQPLGLGLTHTNTNTETSPPASPPRAQWD